MSSAILYLAIVAIWAGFLVPAWVRRPHSRSGTQVEADLTEPFAAETDAQIDVEAELDDSAPEYRDPEYRDVVPDHTEFGQPSRGRPAVQPPAAPPSSVGRQQMMQSRRRMLTIMIALTAVAGGSAAIGLTPWWMVAPPAGMLVAYVLLLREIAMADAEMAVKRENALAARADRLRAREAWAASNPEPTAQIIDISSRVGDQLYDQYADAAVRAVGD